MLGFTRILSSGALRAPTLPMRRRLPTTLALAVALVATLLACTTDDPTTEPATASPTAVITVTPSTTSAPASTTSAPGSETTPPTSTTLIAPVESTTSVAMSPTVTERVDDGDPEGGDNELSPETLSPDLLPDGVVTDGEYVDPRGPIFLAFQESLDRTSRFSGLDSFCRMGSADPIDAPTPVEAGITAESIVIAQIDTRLNELVKVGFGVPVGDPGAMVAAFLDVVNEACGGIHGRSLELRTIGVSALGGGDLDIDTLREAACLEAVEIHEAVVVLAATPIPGTAAGCLTRRHRVSHLAVRGISDLDLLQGQGLLHSIEVGDRTGLSLALGAAIDRGLLVGATIGVVVPDSPQQSDDLMAAVDHALAEVDMTSNRYQIGCEGTTTCQVGLDTAVAAMVADGVDVVVPLVDMTSLPWLILEMLEQQMPRPQFVLSGLDGQGLDAVASRIAEFGGPTAGAYYDGALVVDGSATGAQRLDDAERRPFDRLCVEAWAEVEGVAVPTVESAADDVHRTVVEACSLVRWVARAVEAAGPDPSRLALQVALAGVGPIDVPDMRPTTVDGRRWRTVQVRRYEYPCAHGVGFGASAGCLVPDGPPVVLDRAGVPVPPDGPFSRPPDQVVVFVANASNVGGLAGKVTRLLGLDSYQTTAPGNAYRASLSTIYYREGFLGDARAVGTTLSLPADEVPMPELIDFVAPSTVDRVLTADIVVVIGSTDARRLEKAD